MKKNLFVIFLFLASALFVKKARAIDIDVNGFGSIYYGQSLSPDLLPDGFYDQYPNFSTFSHLGFNVSSRTSERMTVAAQFLAAVPASSSIPGKASAPNTQWEMRAKWGFINYDLTPSFSVKAGRQLLPSLFASEYASVGYLMPYRQIPSYVYSTSPLSGFDGVSATYIGNSDFGETRLIGFTGTGNLDFGYTVSGSQHNLLGLTAELRGNDLQLHASLFRSDIDITLIELATRYTGSINAMALGYRYDNHNLVSWGEYSYVWNPDPQGTFLPYLRGAYILLGYRIGAFMPRYMYSISNQKIASLAPDGAEHSHTLGLNYQLDTKTVLKAEYEMIEIENGKAPTSSTFNNGSTTANRTTAISMGVDFVF